MALRIFKTKFNFKESNSYTGLPAIKGDDGASGTAAGFGTVAATVDGTTGTPSVQVTTSGPNTAKNISFAFSGLKGEGIGAGSFTPLVSYASAQPTSAANNTMWVKSTGYSTVGEVIIGVENDAPVTRPNGAALQGGDLFVTVGAWNAHPIVWGNVTLCPYRAYVWNGGSWVYKETEIKVGGSWYPLSTEWYVENGVVVGTLAYPSTGENGFTTTTSGNMLIFSSFSSSNNNYYLTICGGANSNAASQNFITVLDGYIVNGPGATSFGGTSTAYAGASGSSPSYSSALQINANTTVENPSQLVNQGSATAPALTVCCKSSAQASVGIKNFYKVIV